MFRSLKLKFGSLPLLMGLLGLAMVPAREWVRAMAGARVMGGVLALVLVQVLAKGLFLQRICRS